MLSTFPELLTFGIFAPLALRLSLGAFFLTTGLTRFPQLGKTQKEEQPESNTMTWLVGLVELALGVLLVLGFLTQIAALAGILYAVAMLVVREQQKDSSHLVGAELFSYVFIFAASFSLLVLGAGVLAVDLPL